MRTEADIFYFDDLCRSLTAEQKQAIRQQFVEMLRQQGICQHEGVDVCSFDSVRINCGNSSDINFKRRKRSSGTVSGKLILDIKFNIQVESKRVIAVDCSQYCGDIALNTDECKNICKENYTADALETIQQAVDALQGLFKDNVRIATPTRDPVFAWPEDGGGGAKGRRKTSQRSNDTEPHTMEVTAPKGLVRLFY